jgi:hypothetical protein
MFDVLSCVWHELVGEFHVADFCQGVSVPLSCACSCLVFDVVSLGKQHILYSRSHHLYDHTITVWACDLLVAHRSFVA